MNRLAPCFMPRPKDTPICYTWRSGWTTIKPTRAGGSLARSTPNVNRRTARAPAIPGRRPNSAEEERTLVWEGRRELDRLGFRVTKVHHGRLRRGQVRPSDAIADRSDAAAHFEPYQARGIGLRAVPR